MDKPAPVKHPVHELVAKRWSPRAFDPARGVDERTLLSVLEAARWSPSAYNEQPWAYIVARREDAEAFARVLGCLVPGNSAWAKDAGVLMVACAKLAFERNGKENRHAMHDVGASLAWLTVQAEAMGLRVHQMSGIDTDRCTRDLRIPGGWAPATGVAIGYGADPGTLPPELAERERAPRNRRAMGEFTFGGVFGVPAPFVR